MTRLRLPDIRTTRPFFSAKTNEALFASDSAGLKVVSHSLSYDFSSHSIRFLVVASSADIPRASPPESAYYIWKE